MKSENRDKKRKTLEPRQAPTSTPQAAQMQNVTHTQMQTDQFTTTFHKLISARNEIPKKGREEKKRWNRNKTKDNHNTIPTNATRHACPNTDQTAYNNLQQIDISET